jgi:hypothetical protein
MNKWFKRTRKGNTTRTTYLHDPPTHSYSYGNKFCRVTLTRKRSKIIQTIVRTVGGYRQITKKTISKSPTTKKPLNRPSKVKWNKPNFPKIKFKRTKPSSRRRRTRSPKINMSLFSFKWVMLYFIAVYLFYNLR